MLSESKFPILKEAEEKTKQEPFIVKYSIEAKGWIATGSIKYDPNKEESFWHLAQTSIESVIDEDSRIKIGGYTAILNESYTDGYSRYLRPVEIDKEIDKTET